MRNREKRASLVLGRLHRPPDPMDRLREKVAIVLNTQMGRVPWRPDLGCDLESLVGEAATAERLTEVKWRVEQALGNSLPEVEILDCLVRLVPRSSAMPQAREHHLPLAETALMSLGAEAGLEVMLELRGPEGIAVLQADVQV
ncbi:MAG: hypothetical protein HN348_00160 [Proteobacteria bacterium]|jgi:phage baseplate assembly protein W|nr:hypothetical protein [Pseudomonadota bacterium]